MASHLRDDVLDRSDIVFAWRTHFHGRSTSRIHSKTVRYIDNESVLRKHFIITVGEVGGDDAPKVHKRPIITLQHNPKTGRNLNGERFDKSSRTLEGDMINYRLGYYEQTFLIKQQPVGFTLVNLGKKG